MKDMKKIIFTFVVALFLSIIFFSNLKLLNRPVQNNDEGIYLTTFHLILNGYPPYKETFLSQPPGFLIGAYPGFLLFGQSLQGARITINLWSMIGLLAIIWICSLLKNKWAGALAIGILYFIPYYSHQTLIFQSDSLTSTFSLISLALFFKFRNTKSLKWFITSIIFLNLAFWTKLNFFLIPSFITILLLLIREKKLTNQKIFTLASIFISTSIIFFLIFILPFGTSEIFDNILGLRLAATNLQTPPLSFFTYITQDILFLFLTIATAIIVIIKRYSLYSPLLPIFIWIFTIFVFFLFYRPLYPHHMIIFVIPVVLFFSLSVSSLLRKYTSFYPLIISCILLLAVINYISTIPQKPTSTLTNDQQKAAEIIIKYTKQKDVVVTDEEILNGVTGRFPPPELSDVSFVRILSQNLSPQKFKQIIDDTKPKLIIPWNGRLQSIKNFRSIIKNYKPLIKINDKIIYIRSN